jgi:metal transporter CNNM
MKLTPFLAPIAWPIAKLLDYVLGKNDVHTYKKAELRTFLQFHRTGEEPLRDEEISILNGVLELSTKNVESIMTPMKVGPNLTVNRVTVRLTHPLPQDVVALSSDAILDAKMIDFMCVLVNTCRTKLLTIG